MGFVLSFDRGDGEYVDIPAIKGSPGDQGPPGEVSRAELNDALQTKADAVHKHTAGDIDGLPTFDENASGGSVPKRDAAGRIHSGQPDSMTHLTTKKYVDDAVSGKADTNDITAAIAKLVDGAPAAFDTLKEIAIELESNASARAALANQIATKATITFVESRPVMWDWDGVGTWTPPPGARVGDKLWNTATSAVTKVEAV